MLLLARLVLLAASIGLAECHSGGLRSRRSLQYPASDESDPFPNRDSRDEDNGSDGRYPRIPDEQDQSFETTVKCTRERDALSKQLDKLLADKDRLDVKCEADLRYYREMISMAEQQIDRLKPIVAERLDESDLPPLYMAQYTAIMCTKLWDGFLMDDKGSHREVNMICQGKKKLTACKLERYYALPDEAAHTEAKENSTGYYKQPKLHTEFLRVQHPGSPECFQSKAVQDQVDSTRRSTNTKAKHCAKEVAKRKAELEKMREAEDVLWTKFNSHISQRETIKDDAAKKVTKRFCAVVQAQAEAKRRHEKSGCNNEGNDVIKVFHAENCLA